MHAFRYFCIVVVTTIGYGDNDPIETDGGKLFTALFALLGVSVVFGSLSIVLDVIQEKSKAVAAQAAKAAVAVSFNAPDKAEGDRQSQSVPEQTTIAVDESGTDSAAIPDAQPLSQERGVVGKIVTSARGYYNQSPFLRALLWMLAVMSVGIIFVYVRPAHASCTSLCFARLTSPRFGETAWRTNEWRRTTTTPSPLRTTTPL